MIFTAPEFVVFFLLFFSIYATLRGRPRKLFLLGASYFFCWKWNPMFLAIIVVSSTMNWAVGEALVRFEGHPRRKQILTAGLLANLGILGFFKYYGFFIDSLGDLLELLDLSVHLPLLEVIAPFGISFYTFQTMAYLVDTYRGKAVRPATLLDFLLFISFFPQLLAGPIERATHFLPQFWRQPTVV